MDIKHPSSIMFTNKKLKEEIWQLKFRALAWTIYIHVDGFFTAFRLEK